jgi:four helix bundle protein
MLIVSEIRNIVVNNYKDMIVWQKSMDIVEAIYLVSNTFPQQEASGISSQIRKAAISIPANIAKGSISKKEKVVLEHLDIASGSLAELETLVMISRKLSYLSASNEIFILKQLEEIRKIINALEQSLVKKSL